MKLQQGQNRSNGEKPHLDKNPGTLRTLKLQTLGGTPLPTGCQTRTGSISCFRIGMIQVTGLGEQLTTGHRTTALRWLAIRRLL